MLEKSSWGDGPWQSEPDRKEWRDEETGLVCLAVRNMHLGHWCGYVGIPPSHSAHGKDEDTLDLSVHGGITYAQECNGKVCHIPAPGEAEHLWWLGFDCAHAGDTSPTSLASSTVLRGFPIYGTYRDLAYVEQQCKELASQLVKK